MRIDAYSHTILAETFIPPTAPLRNGVESGLWLVWKTLKPRLIVHIPSKVNGCWSEARKRMSQECWLGLPWRVGVRH